MGHAHQYCRLLSLYGRHRHCFQLHRRFHGLPLRADGELCCTFTYEAIMPTLQGTIIGCAVVPIALCITWKKCNGTGAVVGAIVGFIAAIAGWIGITASLNNGVVTVDTTFGDYEMLTGNLLSIGVGGIITVAWSLVRPANFDWDITRAINAPTHSSQTVIETSAESPSLESPSLDKEKYQGKEPTAVLASQSVRPPNELERQPTADEVERADLQKAFRVAAWAAIGLVRSITLSITGFS
jgi:hypothetical protein